MQLKALSIGNLKKGRLQIIMIGQVQFISRYSVSIQLFI